MIAGIMIIVMCILTLALLFMSSDRDEFLNESCCAIFGFFLCVGITIVVLSSNEKPKAIDVYRGKTTLKITSVDGVPVDSVVVFKEK